MRKWKKSSARSRRDFVCVGVRYRVSSGFLDLVQEFLKSRTRINLVPSGEFATMIE